MANRRGFLGMLVGFFALPQDKKPMCTYMRPLGSGTAGGMLGPVTLTCAEGDEMCPNGHAQKPHPLYAVPADIKQYNSASQLLMEYRGAWLSPRACKECGIVYVPKEEL